MGTIYLDGKFVEELDEDLFSSIDMWINEESIVSTRTERIRFAIDHYGKRAVDLYLAQSQQFEDPIDVGDFPKNLGYNKTRQDYAKECEQECEDFLSKQQKKDLPALLK